MELLGPFGVFPHPLGEPLLEELAFVAGDFAFFEVEDPPFLPGLVFDGVKDVDSSLLKQAGEDFVGAFTPSAPCLGAGYTLRALDGPDRLPGMLDDRIRADELLNELLDIGGVNPGSPQLGGNAPDGHIRG